jgi:hypothetical protein
MVNRRGSAGRRLSLRCCVLVLSVGFAAATGPVAASRLPGGARSVAAPLQGIGRLFLGAQTRVDPFQLIAHGTRVAPLRALGSRPAAVMSGPAQTAGTAGAYTALTPTRLLDTRTSGGALGPGGSRNLTVTGGSVPTDASAVALNVTVTDTTAPSYLTVYPAGDARPLASNLNWVAGETVPNLVVVPVGSGGQVTFYNDAGSTDVVADLEGYFAPETSGTTQGSYVPLTPSRITDTRTGSGEPYAGQTLTGGSTLDVQVAGIGGVPVTGAAAALLNVTVTDTSAASYLTVYPQGAARPLASNLNWVAGDTVPNRVLVPLGPTGQVSFYNDAGTTDLVVDVDGYFTSGATAPAGASLFSPITPVRVLDTRQTGQTLGPAGTLSPVLAGVDGIAANASAVVANVTVTDTTAASYLTVYPGGKRPLASDLNWGPGQTVPNLTVATLSDTGAISAFNDAGRTDLVIDAFGYFVPETPAPLVVTTTSLPASSLGAGYSAGLSAYGGTPPYSWQLLTGALPPGLSLSAAGLISGTTSADDLYSFEVQATDSSPTPETATAQLSILVSPPPVTITTTGLPEAYVGVDYSATLTASGGTAPYTWTLVAGSLPSGMSLSSTGVISGYTASGGITSTFQVKVSDSSSPTAQTASGILSITVAPITGYTATSTNWSGYAMGSGPYTYVSGTFTVPGLYATPGATYMSTWAGIDGAFNTDLIQAGVDEYYDPSTGYVYLSPWWEILPAPETLISMTVLPGDSVTVTIGQISGSEWAIQLTDNTSGQTFLTDQTYTGPGSSVEWIVEAPQVNGALTTLADYSPDVTFTGIRLNGPETELIDIAMVQSGVQVSTPSAFTTGGFTVAYGSTAPPPPP